MFALFLVIAFCLFMLAIYGLFVFIAWAAVGGLNDLTDEIHYFIADQRRMKVVFPRL